MSDLPTFAVTPSTTFLPASAAGPLRCDARLGPIIERFGLGAVLANLSPRRAAASGLLTIGTSGPSGGISSRSAALQSSLESRLRQLLTGSDLCEVTWKPWATPWGACLSKPRARVRTTFGTGIGTWPTARASPNENRNTKPAPSHGKSHGQTLAGLAAVWPTTTTRDHKDGSFTPNVPINGLLGRTVWSTPRSSDGGHSGPNQRDSKGNFALAGEAAHAMWASPRSCSAMAANITAAAAAAKAFAGKHHPNLETQVTISTYPTPSASGFEAKDPQRLLERRQECKERTHNGNGFGLTLGQFATLESSSGSSAPTEKRGALNPEFVCWLMGFPAAWVSCGVSAMRSIPARRKRS
jgi:hypothetical protein